MTVRKEILDHRQVHGRIGIRKRRLSPPEAVRGERRRTDNE
jgi:hypothetical protein